MNLTDGRTFAGVFQGFCGEKGEPERAFGVPTAWLSGETCASANL